MSKKKVVSNEVFGAIVPVTALNEDWIRSLRLVRKMQEGNEKAQEELEKLESTFVFELED